MTALEITIILGTTREGRQTPRISDWIRRKIDRRDDMTSRVVDLRDHPLPFYDRATLPVSGDYGPEGTNFAQVIAPADAFIIITPEYNHGVPAVLKNALDHIYAEWNRKPLAVIGYGGLYGGIRAVEALRRGSRHPRHFRRRRVVRGSRRHLSLGRRSVTSTDQRTCHPFAPPSKPLTSPVG
jgi:NAD(P)H-dependent FMN reductase